MLLCFRAPKSLDGNLTPVKKNAPHDPIAPSRFLRSWLLLILIICSGVAAHAQLKIESFPSGAVELTTGWRYHIGDNPAWASPTLDDSGWPKVSSTNDPGPPIAWDRLTLQLPPGHGPLAVFLLVDKGTGEVYLDGKRPPQDGFLPWWRASAAGEQVLPLPTSSTTVVIALRRRMPALGSMGYVGNFTAWVGSPNEMKSLAAAHKTREIAGFLVSGATNLVIVIAGLGIMLLYLSQRSKREYLWLGVYLLLLGSSFGTLSMSSRGVGPGVVNDLWGDPVIFLFTVAQIEFTYAFIQRRPNILWRIYEAFVLGSLLLSAINLFGAMNVNVYLAWESIVVTPAAVALPIVLFYWWRRGNREAGWLILPSLFPAAGVVVTNAVSLAQALNWQPIPPVLLSPRLWGIIPFADYDIADAIFLLAIGIVIFFRFTRVSREQARAAAELDAARTIQRQLVPVSLPEIEGFHVETAYLPADEVGGDFYQVLPQTRGRTLILVGDVSGKGLKAAMTGALAIGALRAMAEEELSPGTLLEKLNRQVTASQDTGFITCICARLDLDGTLTLANAGHLSPYRNGEEIACGPALPLGLTPDTAYTETTLRLGAGDLLTFLSDGVLEAQSSTSELFGFDRMRAISRESAQHIAEAARRFGQQDDITVLTLSMAPIAVSLA